jgi:hypothetical protein
MAKFLILHSSNKSNIGIIRDYSDTYISPDAIKLTEQEDNEWNTISAMERKFRLEEYKSTNDKKKIFKNAELVESQIENVSVEMPEVEVEEPLNEPINKVKDAEYNEIKEGYKEKAKEIAKDHIELMKELVNDSIVNPKAKRAYNKKVKTNK